MTLDVVEFIRRYLMHILPPGFVKIRHFGFLANRSRREALRRCRSLLPMPATAPSDSLTATQRHAVERTCPLCRIGTLHILDWIPAGTLLPPNEKPSVNHRDASKSPRSRAESLIGATAEVCRNAGPQPVVIPKTPDPVC
jgi:hypothetical protein